MLVSGHLTVFFSTESIDHARLCILQNSERKMYDTQINYRLLKLFANWPSGKMFWPLGYCTRSQIAEQRFSPNFQNLYTNACMYVWLGMQASEKGNRLRNVSIDIPLVTGTVTLHYFRYNTRSFAKEVWEYPWMHRRQNVSPWTRKEDYDVKLLACILLPVFYLYILLTKTDRYT